MSAAIKKIHEHTLTQIALAEKAQEKGGSQEFSYHAGYISAMRLMECNLRMVVGLEAESGKP